MDKLMLTEEQQHQQQEQQQHHHNDQHQQRQQQQFATQTAIQLAKQVSQQREKLRLLAVQQEAHIQHQQRQQREQHLQQRFQELQLQQEPLQQQQQQHQCPVANITGGVGNVLSRGSSHASIRIPSSTSLSALDLDPSRARPALAHQHKRIESSTSDIGGGGEGGGGVDVDGFHRQGRHGSMDILPTFARMGFADAGMGVIGGVAGVGIGVGDDSKGEDEEMEEYSGGDMTDKRTSGGGDGGAAAVGTGSYQGQNGDDMWVVQEEKLERWQSQQLQQQPQQQQQDAVNIDTVDDDVPLEVFIACAVPPCRTDTTITILLCVCLIVLS